MFFRCEIQMPERWEKVVASDRQYFHVFDNFLKIKYSFSTAGSY